MYKDMHFDKKIRKSVFEFLKYYSLKYNDFSDYSDLHRNRLRSFEDYHPRARLRSLMLLFIRRRLFFSYKATRIKRSEKKRVFRHFSPFFFFYRFFIREWKNYDTSFSISRFSRGDEGIKLGIKLRWKVNFARLVNMLILRVKILFYRPWKLLWSCGKRKRLSWANKNARWIDWCR